MHGHGSNRTERVCTKIFWRKSKYGRAHLLALRPDDGDDVGGADRTETLRGRVVANCGYRITSMLSQAEEDVDTHPN